MKKKGFTLVELLGVIIVLAIIALITMPIVSGVVSRAKKKSFENSIYGLIKSADLFYANNFKEMKDSDEYIFDCDKYECKTKNGDELAYKGERPTSGQIIVHGDGTIEIINLSNGKYYANKDVDETVVIITDEPGVLTKDELTEIVKQLQDKIKDIKTDEDILNKKYPIGSIYITTDLKTKEEVGKIIGGTWEVYGAGRTLVGVGSNGKIDYITSGLMGGKNNITLNIENLPSHNHSFTASGTVSSTFKGSKVNTSTVDINHRHDFSATTSTDGSHSHLLHPSICAMGWPDNATTSSKETFVGWGTSSSIHLNQISLTTDSYSHNHTVNGTTGWMRENNNHSHTFTASGTVSSTFTGTKANTSNTGKGESFSTQDPYITVYMYKRVK